MNKRSSLITICLVLIYIITGCSRTKTVKTKETKEFTKAILESNGKIKSLKFYFTRPRLKAEMIYEGDLADIDFRYLIQEFEPLIEIDFMQEIGGRYWAGEIPWQFDLNVHVDEKLDDAYDYQLFTRYNKEHIRNEDPDNIDGYETWHINDKNYNEISVPKEPSRPSEAVYRTEYDKAKIKLLSNQMGFKSQKTIEIREPKIISTIDLAIKNSLTPTENSDLENNHTNQYQIEMSNDIGGYSCVLYYDTLYDKAYLGKDGGLDETGIDFARYIESLLENTNIMAHIEDFKVLELFQSYGWTLDYEISKLKSNLEDINVLSEFNSNQYYFAYNNELSKDIGLDMGQYANSTNMSVEIYRIHESMPQAFYPIQNARGIVVKRDDQIIGAFISAGRHSAFDACSLKGNSFEQVRGQTLDQWFEKMIHASNGEKKLSKLEPEQVIEKYFMALNHKDVQAAASCLSKKNLLGNLTSNMPNDELFNERISLPLTNADMEAKSSFKHLRSAKLLQVKERTGSDENTKIFGVTVDLKYKGEGSIGSTEQIWDCHMVYESPQTGWKIEEFGHFNINN